MQPQLNDLADDARDAIHVRGCLDARGGHGAQRRLVTDPSGYSSLRG